MPKNHINMHNCNIIINNINNINNININNHDPDAPCTTSNKKLLSWRTACLCCNPGRPCSELRVNPLRLLTSLLVFALMFSVLGCKKASPIGEIVFEAPITALMFEMGEDDGEVSGGVVYRRVNDINLLLAQEDVPVLVAFLDGRALSNAAIPFTEELCDKFSTTARIIRVNVQLSENEKEIDNLISLFGVTNYPCFAVAYKGQRKSSVSGYTAETKATVIEIIQNATK